MSCTSKPLFASEAIRPELCVRYLPVMIGRLVISLKKAASQEDLWGLGRPIINVGVGFDEGHGSGVTGDDIRMDTFAGGDEGTHGRV